MPTFYVIFAMFLAYWIGKKQGKVITVYKRSGVPFRPKEEFREGQIVFVSHPGKNCYDQNMITHILSINKDLGYATIRSRGSLLEGETTAGVRFENLTALPVDENFPLQFPGEPVYKPGKWNEAKWYQVPLSWFTYDAPCPAPKEKAS